MDCCSIVESICPKKHRYNWKCHKGAPKSCPKCEHEKQIEEQQKQRDFELELKRQESQRQHAKRLAEIQQRIEEQKQIVKDIADEKERQSALAQKVQDLEQAQVMAERAKQPQPQPHLQMPPSNRFPSSSSGPPTSSEVQTQDRALTDCPETSQTRSLESASRDEWERQKEMEGQSDTSLDALMSMIGLEEVKSKFLSIKAKVDTVVRQNTSLKDERFSAALLGNPGTGMCNHSQILTMTIEPFLEEQNLTSLRENHRRSPLCQVFVFCGSYSW